MNVIAGMGTHMSNIINFRIALLASFPTDKRGALLLSLNANSDRFKARSALSLIVHDSLSVSLVAFP